MPEKNIKIKAIQSISFGIPFLLTAKRIPANARQKVNIAINNKKTFNLKIARGIAVRKTPTIPQK